MTNEVRDLDDVEAQAWATIYAAWSTFAHESAEGHADEGIKILRDRRASRASSVLVRDAAYRAKHEERKAIAEWLRAHGGDPGAVADLIARGDHDE